MDLPASSELVSRSSLPAIFTCLHILAQLHSPILVDDFLVLVFAFRVLHFARISIVKTSQLSQAQQPKTVTMDNPG
jgi:hypothetical protein